MSSALLRTASNQLWAVVSAPSPTVVAFVDSVQEAAQDLDVRCRWLLEWAACRQFAVSKVVLLGKAADSLDRHDMLFVQVLTQRQGGGLEVGADCGNSMTAAAASILHGNANLQSVNVRNVKTGLSVRALCAARTLAELSLDMQIELPHAGVRPHDIVCRKRSTLTGSFLRPFHLEYFLCSAFNPYVLVHEDDLRRFVGHLGGALNDRHAELDAAIRLRELLRDATGCADLREFPKLCIYREGDNPQSFTGRTLYLDEWHPHLPLTGTLTVCLLAWTLSGAVHNIPPMHVRGHSGASQRVRLGVSARDANVVLQITGRRASLLHAGEFDDVAHRRLP